MREFGIAAYRLFLRTRKVSGSTEERGKLGKHARNKFINETDVKVGGVSSGTQGRFLTFGAKRSRATTPLPPWRSPRTERSLPPGTRPSATLHTRTPGANAPAPGPGSAWFFVCKMEVMITTVPIS